MRKFIYDLATDKAHGLVPSILKLLLLFLSLLYGLVIRAAIIWRGFFSVKLNAVVISVGNITVGGTGKTTLVEYIARFLQSQGRKVAVLTRGYRRLPRKTKSKQDLAAAMGDEPYMLSEKLKNIPVIVDANRVRGAKRAISDYGVDTLILDDGLQQWAIKKDLEIVTVNSLYPFGNRHMLPRGILRQPFSTLACADVFFLTKTSLNPAGVVFIKNDLDKLNPKALIAESDHSVLGFYELNNPQRLLAKHAFSGKTVAAFSGIGDPESFEGLLAVCGVKVAASFRFADHHYYKQQDIDRILKHVQEKGIDIIVTTEKDAARLKPFSRFTIAYPFFVMRIGLAVKEEELFHARLLKLYSF